MYINFDSICTPAQLQVVTLHDGPILCVACPGSGKTHTLVTRAAHMVQHNIDPESILIVTFTRKAAHEFQERLVKLIGPDAKGIHMGTFHSVALQLIRKHFTLLGFEHPFTVMSQGDITDLMKGIRGDAKEYIEDGIKLPYSADILSFFSSARNRCEDVNERIQEECQGYEDAMRWMYSEYTQKKREMCVVDYDDILFGLHYILSNYDDLRATYSRKFRYIMVDEFQDTNRIQFDIVLMLTDQHDNLMVVGDEGQSIYKFRGAEVENILTIHQHFDNMRIMKLEENHRSSQHIVDVCNTTMSHAKEKLDKTMRSALTGDFLTPKICTPENGVNQAEYVTKTLQKLHREGTPYSDIAVLFRNSYHANILDMKLSQANIPFVKWGGVKFTEAAHILDVLAFIKIRVNQYDYVSWKRALTMIPGIGQSAARKIYDAISPQEEENPFLPTTTYTLPWEALRDFQGRAKYVDGLRRLGSFLTNLNLYTDVESIFEMLWEYYEPYCQQMYVKEFDFRRHGIFQLRDMASKYDSLAEFLDEFATEDVIDDEESGDAVTLSTIHSAKGCEWKYVFVIELVEGALPSYRNPDDEEELRLFNVACSRAKEGLFLVYPKQCKTQDGRTERTVQSRFVRRILEVK